MTIPSLPLAPWPCSDHPEAALTLPDLDPTTLSVLCERRYPPPPTPRHKYRARICKSLRSPGIDSKDRTVVSVPPLQPALTTLQAYLCDTPQSLCHCSSYTLNKLGNFEGTGCNTAKSSMTNDFLLFDKGFTYCLIYSYIRKLFLI